MPSDRASCRVTHVEALSARVRRLEFRREAPLAFRAGQHVALGRVGDAEQVSYYSFASAFDPERPGHFELAVARGPSSIGEIELGDELLAQGPLGQVMLDVFPVDAPLVLVAMGTGVAPLRAVAQEVWRGRNEATPPRSLWLVHGAREEEDCLFRGEFEAAARRGLLDYRPVLSRPTVDYAGRRGRVQDHLVELCSPSHRFLVCGSLGMVESTLELLHAHGVPAEHVFAEGY